MKKLISLSLALLLCFSMVFAMSSCASKHPLEEFAQKIEKTKSYQMVITMSDIPIFGTMSITTKVDGNIQYTPEVLMSPEQYIETVGDIRYVYAKGEDGNWTKAQEEVEKDSSDLDDFEEMKDFFNPENFEAVEGKEKTFKQKKDVTFDDFSEVVVTLTDDGCTLETKATSKGMVMSVKIEISHIGEIELTLPEVK